MKSNIKIHHAVAFVLVSLFLSFALFSGCEKEVEKIVTVVETDTLVVTIRDTVVLEIIPIVVDTINANPDSVSQGGSIEFTVSVTSTPMAGGDLTYAWSATSGTIDHPDQDTVTWKAPDDEGVYTVRVTVSDGEYAGAGERMVGVGMYAPTTEPYFVGGQGTGCTCHQSTVDDWAMTAHSHAWASLQESGHPQSFCNPCHTVQDTIPGNSGYDEAPIALFENVQCENCHGPASGHPAAGEVAVDWNVNNCGICHDGTHHPYLTEWLSSPHNFDANAHPSGSCSGCHEGVAAGIRLSGGAASYPLSSFYGGGSISERPDTTEAAYQNVVCQACHDPHSKDNPGQLRTVVDVPLVTANGESPIITDGGVGKLCMHCHHARRGPESQIANGYAHFGPHANPQADMMAGKSAFHGVAPGFEWASPSHLLVQNSCKTCHLNQQEYGAGPGGAAVTGHEFIPKIEACANCHGPITSFRDIPASGDFDGNGQVEGLQDEVEGLMNLLEAALVDSFAARGITIADTDELLDSLGSVTASSVLMRESGYNFAYIHDDKSLGIHNPDYAVQLLQQSYLHLTGTLPKNAKAVIRDNQVVMNW
jgi:hypothetical protein